MDWFDRIAIGAVAVLAVGSVVLMHDHRGNARPDRTEQQRKQPAAAPLEDIGPQLAQVRTLIEAGNLDQAESLAQALRQRYPADGGPALLLGDVSMRRQDPVAAMHRYKDAIELNPDYLDKKTPLFQGKKLKVAVGEAQAEIEKQLRQHPGDESLKREKKMIYYLYRKIAGSCG